MIDDVAELLWKETEVERMEHRSHAGDCEVSFHVFLSIPCERSDAISFFYAEPFERSREPFRAIRNHPVAGASRAVSHKRDDLAVGVNSAPVLENISDRQWTILHSALHRGLLVISSCLTRVLIRFSEAVGLS